MESRRRGHAALTGTVPYGAFRVRCGYGGVITPPYGGPCVYELSLVFAPVIESEVGRDGIPPEVAMQR